MVSSTVRCLNDGCVDTSILNIQLLDTKNWLTATTTYFRFNEQLCSVIAVSILEEVGHRISTIKFVRVYGDSSIQRDSGIIRNTVGQTGRFQPIGSPNDCLFERARDLGTGRIYERGNAGGSRLAAVHFCRCHSHLSRIEISTGRDSHINISTIITSDN